MSSVLHAFVTFSGLRRFSALFAALQVRSASFSGPALGDGAVAVALLIALLPGTALLSTVSLGIPELPLYVTGAATVLAILYRVSQRIEFRTTESWRDALSLTHTAFAIGCIPVACIMLLYPETLSQVGAVTKLGAAQEGPRIRFAELAFIAVKISMWAAVTEEFLYRGLLLSVLRRWRRLRSPFVRDGAAVAISGIVFGLMHVPTWGALMGVALSAIGIGLGLAFIATREALLPLIIYHAAFNTLSLLAAALLR